MKGPLLDMNCLGYSAACMPSNSLASGDKFKWEMLSMNTECRTAGRYLLKENCRLCKKAHRNRYSLETRLVGTRIQLAQVNGWELHFMTRNITRLRVFSHSHVVTCIKETEGNNHTKESHNLALTVVV